MLNKLKQIGPGAMVAAAFIGPGTVTTATIAGAGFGYTLLWAITFSIIATYILQEMSARIGIIAGIGLGEALRKKCNSKLKLILSSVLVLGAVLIGNAAYEAGNITGAVLGLEQVPTDWFPFSFSPFILIIGAIAFYLLFMGKYQLIERSLVGLVSVMGVVFLVTAIALRPNVSAILKSIIIPDIPDNALLMVIGLIGTTVVPYNLFLHASSVKRKWGGVEDLGKSRWDTMFSVVLGGIITMAIMICAAVAFEGSDRNIQSAADLSIQLKPILGPASGPFIAIGFLAAGLSSAVTAPLAAAFATSEMASWKGGMKDWKFRCIWLFVLVSGVVFSMLGFRPTSVIFFAQVANGILLPVIAIFLLWIMNDRSIMGDYTNKCWVNYLGILVTFITLVLGCRGVYSAINSL